MTRAKKRRVRDIKAAIEALRLAEAYEVAGQLAERERIDICPMCPGQRKTAFVCRVRRNGIEFWMCPSCAVTWAPEARRNRVGDFVERIPPLIIGGRQVRLADWRHESMYSTTAGGPPRPRRIIPYKCRITPGGQR